MKSILTIKPVAIAASLVLALGATTAACGDDDDDGAGGTEKVTLLLSFPESIVWSPLLVARDQGYFEEEGIEVETQPTEGSGFVTQQIIAGNADYGWAAGDSGIVAYARDPDLRVVQCNQQRNIFRIVVLEDSDIQSVDDLSGQELGITEKGGGEEPLVTSALNDAGIFDEVQQIAIGPGGPQSAKAIEDGTVDAFAGSYPDLSTMTAAGLTFRDITPEKFDGTPGDCLVVSSDTLESNKDTVEAITRGWAKGAVFTIANPDAALDIACGVVPEECADMNVAQQLMEDTAEFLKSPTEDLPISAPNLQGWESTAQVLLDVGTIEQEVDVETLVDSPEVQEIVDAYADIDTEAVEEDAENYQAG